MLFNYKAIDESGESREGLIDAINVDIAISSLQKRGLIVSSIKGEEEKSFVRRFSFFQRVSNKEIVIVSR